MPILNLQPAEASASDTYIDASNPTTNFGGNASLVVLGPANTKRILIFFSLSSIPNDAFIVSATLRLRCSSVSDTGGQSVDCHRLISTWVESQATWNERAGGISWGVAGGQSGVDYDATATASTSVTVANADYDWNVTQDVRDFENGVESNVGWILLTGGFRTKTFKSSSDATAADRPELIINYEIPQIIGSTGGTCTVTAVISARGELIGSVAGSSTVIGTMISNQNARGSADGTSTVSGFLGANVYIQGNAFGDSTAIADIKASYHSQGSAAGTSVHVAHLKGIFNLEGLIEGSSTVTAVPTLEGQMRASTDGTSDVTGTGYARAKSVANVIGCNPVPLFYITDGSIKSNGQLNILNFLSEKNGYLLRNYRPQIAQYKDGGKWSSSPQSQGRRLRSRVFDNAIDVLEVAATASDQDALIEYQQDLLAFQEAAADYWASKYPLLPYYLVARAARESNIRYAIIHMISCPELENPYSQPFFDHSGATFESLTIRIERGVWLSTPPGKFDCVEISSQKEWTVSGWQTGS